MATGRGEGPFKGPCRPRSAPDARSESALLDRGGNGWQPARVLVDGRGPLVCQPAHSARGRTGEPRGHDVFRRQIVNAVEADDLDIRPLAERGPEIGGRTADGSPHLGVSLKTGASCSHKGN